VGEIFLKRHIQSAVAEVFWGGKQAGVRKNGDQAAWNFGPLVFKRPAAFEVRTNSLL
jgi:hypothetical protein